MKTSPFRILFWLFYGGSLALPLITSGLGAFNIMTHQDYVLGGGRMLCTLFAGFLCTVGLCFVSAAAVKNHPKLAKQGMITVGILILFYIVGLAFPTLRA